MQWEHVEALYTFDKRNHTRMVPKLTERHVSLPPFSALKVRYAAQVISHSVASALSVLVQLKVLSEEANVTASFLDQFDRLFNAFNSRTLHSPQPMGHAFTGTSGHIQFLKESQAWLTTVKSKSRSEELPCLYGWRMAVRALLGLWEELSMQGFKFLLTSRLNQDCLENFFSRIRFSAGHVDNPSAGEFRRQIRHLLVDQISVHSKNSNCEDDAGKFLIHLKHLKPSAEHQEGAVLGVDGDDHTDELSVLSLISTPLPPSKDIYLQRAEDTVLTYIAGYIVKKIKLKLCASCKSAVTGCVTGSLDQLLLINKQLPHCKDGLEVPSTQMAEAVHCLENAYISHVQKILYQDKVKEKLSVLLRTEICSRFPCPLTSCQTEGLIVEKFVNIRLHFTLKECSASFSSKGQKRNRKLMKVNHL